MTNPEPTHEPAPTLQRLLDQARAGQELRNIRTEQARTYFRWLSNQHTRTDYLIRCATAGLDLARLWPARRLVAFAGVTPDLPEKTVLWALNQASTGKQRHVEWVVDSVDPDFSAWVLAPDTDPAVQESILYWLANLKRLPPGEFPKWREQPRDPFK